MTISKSSCFQEETQYHSAPNATAYLKAQPLLESACCLSQEDAIYKSDKL